MRETVILLFLVLSVASVLTVRLSQADSCVGRCEDPYDSSATCQCNTACENHSDCCSDYWTECQQSLSCEGKCEAGYDPGLACQCNSECPQHANCCPDYDLQCGGQSGSLTDTELQQLSELLLSVDSNNVGSMIELELGCTTNNGNPEDCSPNPLFKSVDPAVETLPVYAALAKLFDNYNPSPSQGEDHTLQEQEEEQDLLEEMMRTDVMRTALQFLVDRGVFTGSDQDWKDYLYKIWFKLYDRAFRETLGSSGFEHVFVGECCKGGDVGGFHGWYHYYLLERRGDINYLGHWDQASFGTDMMLGGGISLTFTWNGTQKPYGSFFVGTSPELEMALYTVCFMTRPDAKCHVRLGGADVYIQTWTYSQSGDVLVGSAYPDWAL